MLKQVLVYCLDCAHMHERKYLLTFWTKIMFGKNFWNTENNFLLNIGPSLKSPWTLYKYQRHEKDFFLNQGSINHGYLENIPAVLYCCQKKSAYVQHNLFAHKLWKYIYQNLQFIE